MSKLKIISATGDFAGFVEGQKLKTAQDQVTYMRAVVNEGLDEPTDMSDDDILAIIQSVDGDSEDSEVARCELIEAGNVPSDTGEVAPVTAQDNSTHARSIGAELSKVKGFNDEMGAIIQGDEKVKAGPLALMFIAFNAKGAEWMNGLPVPDTKTGNNAEFYKTSAKDTGTGESKTIPGNAFTEAYQATARGAAEVAELEQIRLVSNPETKGKATAEYQKNAGKGEWLGKRKKLLTSRLTAGRSNMKRMAKCWHKKASIENMAGVTVEFDTVVENGVETLAEGRYPVTLRKTAGKAKDYQTMTVSQFIKLNTEKAKTIGGDLYLALLKTLERGTKKDAPKTQGPITDPSEIFVQTSRFNNYLDWQSPEGKKHQIMLIDYYSKPEHKEEMLAFGRMYNSLDPIYGAIEKQYDVATRDLAATLGSDLKKNAA